MIIAGTTPLPTAWTEWLMPVLIKQFASTSGPIVNIPESPLDMFELFFSYDLLDMIVEESNIYAAQVMGDERYREWRKITKEEVKAFFGFSILMGIDHLHQWMTTGAKILSFTMLPLQTESHDGISVRSPGTCTLLTMTILLHEETPHMIGLGRCVL